MKNEKKIILAVPRGFCAGVRRALDTVEKAGKHYKCPVFVRHEIVHNKFIVNELRRKGVRFVENVEEVPRGAPLIFSAHGVSPEVEGKARNRGLKVIDATCPLVKKIHHHTKNFHALGHAIIIIGDKKHPEVTGAAGQVEDRIFIVEKRGDVRALPEIKETKIACLTQTTLTSDETEGMISEIKKRFPCKQISLTNDICYATRNRQDAVRRLAEECDVIFILGSKNSSNANRLLKIALKNGIRAYLVSGRRRISPDHLKGVSTIGVSAGASTPEILVERFISNLSSLGWEKIETVGVGEKEINFKMPAMA